MLKERKEALIAIAGAILFFVAPTFAHKGETHRNEEQKHLDVSSSEKQTLQNLNAEYVAQVKPIFQRSCMNCHSTNTEYPWYYTVPGARQLIDRDVKEAKSHLDMTKDFPFGGHGTPTEDLEAIQSSLEKDTMPPFRYRALHWSSQIKPEELKIIRTWIQKGLQELNSHENHN